MKVYYHTSNGTAITKVPELESPQEEADIKMFLCVPFAASLGFDSVHIVTIDSDIGILALYYQNQLKVTMYLEIGTCADFWHIIKGDCWKHFQDISSFTCALCLWHY